MVIGSHGWAHRDWRSLDWGLRGAIEVEEEMVRARQHLGRLTGTDVSEVAVPFGSYDRHVLRILRRTGVDAGLHQRRRLGAARRRGCRRGPASTRDDGPDWPRRVMVDRPGLGRRARTRVAQAAKRLRG